MRFEFDAAKSAANRDKHGIDFVDAQALWNDPQRFERTARSTTEARLQVVGAIGNIIWSAIVTYRHEDIIRIISVRRARHEEQARYFDEP